MNNMMIDEAYLEKLRTFHLPQYGLIPDIGLYLEQTTQYVNHCLKPLGCIEITSSMIRNYVKMGLVDNPVRKQYFAGHIAHIIVIAAIKQVLSLDQIQRLFHMQKKVYTDEVAYDYFCNEFENVLMHRFGFKDSLESVGTTHTREKEMLRSTIIAVSHIIYLNACFSSDTTSQDSIPVEQA